MPDIQINVEVAGADQAADDLKNIGNAARDTGGDIKSAGSDISSTTQSLSSFKSSLAGVVGSFTAISSGVLNLVRSFTQMEQAQIRLDTANRRVETSAQAVTKAQEKYNDAVAKYGPNSEQARAAADKLKTTIEGHQIAIDRANLQQQKFNETLASLATEIVPNVIGVFGSIVGAISSFTSKGAEGVSLAGKLKQSFLDLVSGGTGVKGALDSAGTAMGGLGTKAETAGRSTGGLRGTIQELGAGVSQVIPNVANFGGGLTNTGIAAERSVGPLANIERSVASTGVSVAEGVAPLAAFGGGMGAMGTAAEGAVGGVEAAAVATGALETGSAAAAAESVGLATAVGGVSIGLAAETAGISLAIGAMVAYMLNIGGVKDKTDAAVVSAEKFLAIGWEGWAKKFEPVTKALDGALKKLDELANHPFATSGQFGPQPAPGKALGPSGRPLDETINAETGAMAKGTAGILNMVNAFKQLAEQRTQQEGLSKTGVANSNANAAAFASETQSLKTVTEAQKQAADAAKRAADEAKANAEAQKIGVEAINRLVEAHKNLQAQSDAAKKVFDDLSNSITKNNGTIEANNKILTTSAGQAQLYSQGVQDMTLKLQSNEMQLTRSQAALAQLDANLQRAQIDAYSQGWTDFNMTLDETNTTAAHTQGVFDAFVASLGTSKQAITDFNAGFTQGEADIQKWAEGLLQANAAEEGQRAALEQIIPKLGVQLPQGLNLSVEGMKRFTEAIGGGLESVKKAFEEADKVWSSALSDFNKAATAAPGDMQKAMGDLQKAQQDAFQELQKALQSHTGNQQQAWASYYQKVREAQDKFNTDSHKSWDDYYAKLREKFGNYLTTADQQWIAGMATLQRDIETAVNGLSISLSRINIGDTSALPEFQRKWSTAVDTLVTDLQKIPGATSTNIGPLIQVIKSIPVNTIGDAGRAFDVMRAAEEAINKPNATFASVSKAVWDALNGVTKTNADGTITKVGGAAQGASAGVDGLGNSMSTLTANTGFAASALEALKTQWIDPLTNTTLTIKITADTGAATSALSTLTSQWITPLESGDTIIHVTADTGAATSALSTLANQWITPLESGDTIVHVTADTGPAVSAISTLVNQWITPLEGQTIIPITANTGPAISAIGVVQNTIRALTAAPYIVQITANTGPAISAIGVVQNTIRALTAAPYIVQITANTGPAISAIGVVQNTIRALTAAQYIVQITANTGPAISAIGVLQNTIRALTAAQYIVQITANTGPAISAIGVVQNTIRALIAAPYTIQITANTAQAQQAISALQQQLASLRAQGTATGIPLGFARTGGLFELVAGGFKRKKRGDQLHAAGGGSFIVTKETKLANLTVGEGNRPELLQFTRARGGRGIGMLMVTPIKAPRMPRIRAQGGGLFTPGAPNLAGGPMGFIPAGGFQQSGGQPQEYNIPAPVQTVGQGGPQQGMPSEVGAGTILVGPGGQAVRGSVTAPPGGGPAGGFGGLIPGAPSSGNYEILPQTGLPTETNVPAPVAQGGTAQTTAVPSSGASDVSPYEVAQMTGQAVADEQAPQQTRMQNDIADLLAAVRRLIAKISMRDVNANLIVDGQKMATTVSRYIGSGAYGGR